MLDKAVKYYISGQIIEAKKNLQKYVTLAPNAKDVEIVKSYLN